VDLAQHFLKSAELRDLTAYDVACMSEEEAFEHFIKVRWGDRDHATCPHCGVVHRHFYRKTRRQWRCKDCNGYFSVTTHTVFEHHKLRFKKLLLGLMEFVASANGASYHKLCRIMDVQVKTAHAFVGKLRESLWRVRHQTKLQGVVQIDGGHFGGRPRHGRMRSRPRQEITDHVVNQLEGKKKPSPRKGKSRANWHRFKKRRVIMNIRELYPQPGLGACKTITAVCLSENEADALQLARMYIEPGFIVMTDENPAYNQFALLYDHRTVQHAVEFSTIDGVNDNQAESYFSRLRRYVLGVSHRIEPKYMGDIAIEMAWREDVRRNTEEEKLTSLLKAAFRGKSEWWRGYWQGVHRQGELQWATIT
jgi:transposase-like protein